MEQLYEIKDWDTEKRILWKLWRRRLKGDHKLSLRDIKQGFDKNEYSLVEKKLRSLAREGIVSANPCKKGMQYYISSKRSKEVKRKLKIDN